MGLHLPAFIQHLLLQTFRRQYFQIAAERKEHLHQFGIDDQFQGNFQSFGTVADCLLGTMEGVAGLS